ncbi:iron-containing redox enzyme family protein [Myxococcota bacterium]|nr:iron-containing redox enzyme family protein [Myxococcota bacterium]
MMSEKLPANRQGIDTALRNRLSMLGKLEKVAAGVRVIEEGAYESHLFMIEEGAVEVLDAKGQPLDSLYAGDLVGEFAFIENTPRTRDVVMSLPGQLRRIERSELLTELASEPQELAAMLLALGELRDRRRDDLEGDATSFVSELARTSLQSRGVDHPYLHALAKGDLPDVRFALADFATQYSGYSNHFPRYLSTLIGRLENHEHRFALLENLTEESGLYEEKDIANIENFGINPDWIVGVPHPLLFKRFQDAVGGRDHSPEEESDQVVCWRELFIGLLTHGSAAEAIGAVGLGTESIVSEIYKPFVATISRLGLSARDTVFFPLHTLVDDHHQETLKQIAATFATTREGRTGLRRGMIKALSLRSAFWDWLYARAIDPEKADAVV